MKIHPTGINVEDEFEMDIPGNYIKLTYFIAGTGDGTSQIITHAHPYYEVFMLRSGTCLQICESETYRLGANDLIIAKPGQPHEISGDGTSEWKYYCIAFYTSDIQEIDNIYNKSTVTYLPDCSELISLCEKIRNESREAKPGMSNMIQSYVTEFVVGLSRKLGSSEKNRILHSYSQEVVKARIYIEQNFRHDLSINEIAEQICVSPALLSKHFSEEMHISIHKYAKKLLMQRAASLLSKKELTISEIAEKLGFPSIHYFSASFKHHWGITPSEYKQNPK